MLVVRFLERSLRMDTTLDELSEKYNAFIADFRSNIILISKCRSHCTVLTSSSDSSFLPLEG
jgi:hypothetical protein